MFLYFIYYSTTSLLLKIYIKYKIRNFIFKHYKAYCLFRHRNMTVDLETDLCTVYLLVGYQFF